MICIKNAKVVLENSILPDGVILIDGERIVAVGTQNEISLPQDCTCIDAGGAYVGPGFVDIHVHGGGEAMFYENPEKAAAHFLARGETTQLATLYYDLDKESFAAAIDRIKAAMAHGTAAKAIAGFYMEGPYMNPKYGASAEKNRWRGQIKEADYRLIVDRAGDLAHVWAVAPERDGIAPFMAYAKEVNPNTVFAVGHSEATPAQIRALKHYGICLQTHCMNATGRHSDWLGTRGSGPDEACLLDRDMYAELISDSLAVHVNPDLQKLILQVKGIDKLVLISDSFVSAEPSPESMRHVTDLSFDAGGNLSGSRLTMDAACRNLMQHTGCSINDASLAASRNGARAIGMGKEIGTIEIGKLANLVFVDELFHVQQVMLRGKLQ